MRMLGSYRVPGCCPGTRAGRQPGADCSGGGPLGTRKAKRIEARQVADEIAGALGTVPCSPLEDLSDCLHGCNGDCVSSGSEYCNFTCHAC